MAQFVTFRVAHHDYGLPIEHVQSIEPVLPITPLPGAAPFVLGLIHLRGSVLPVLDLRRFLGLPAADWTEETRLVVVQWADVQAALVVDSVHDVADVADEDIQAAPDVVGPLQAEQVAGVTLTDRGMLVLPRLERLFDPELAVVAEHEA
ncbi:hypothetical protein GCM10010885_20480 [Alicyclobacillus cellulosilyticus]|uniref:CheW-like domain-containing protein n=1 Tax=Alicyclobacillus cellulosilyticus TaxID=1003997 RepID=A0A917KG94_9BACL|nr:chemotaxis protein CheW [Alicyclobacillus cellulosilyticus]GGJ11123.1 hypothetical protein GCM10010885_20480 [Alicyclobacillus cellulosilyticus]